MKALLENIDKLPETAFVYRQFNLPAFPFAWHFHAEYELTLVVEGRGKRFVGDHIGEFEEGDLVFMGPNLPHTYHSTPTDAKGRCRTVVIQFLHDFLGEPFLSLAELGPIRSLMAEASSGIRFSGAHVNEIAASLQVMKDLKPLPRLTSFLSILNLLAETVHRETLCSSRFVPALRSEDQTRMDRLSRFINAHFTGSVSLDEAAAQVHMSVSAFTRFFKRTTGRPFNTYLNELRIGAACRQLIETDQTVAQIAFATGFNNLSNFNRRFLDLKGRRPQEFRKDYVEARNAKSEGLTVPAT